MSSVFQAHPLPVAAAVFVTAAVAVTLFSVLVSGDPVVKAALGSLGYAVGGSIGVYIVSAGVGPRGGGS